LVSSWISIVFFIYEIAAILLLVTVATKPDIELSRLCNPVSLKPTRALDILALLASVSLLLLDLLKLQSTLLLAPLSLLCSSLIPGYVLLRLTNRDANFSWLELFLFSYLLSYTYTALVWLGLLSITESIRTPIFLVVLSFMSHISLLSGRASVSEKPRPASFARGIDLLVLVFVVGIVAIGIVLIYPGFVYLTGTDMMRHYAFSIVLGRTPDLYTGFVYLFAHLHQSAFLASASVSLAASQTTLVMLNMFLPVAFYIASKRLLSGVDDRIPSIATMVWILFTNSLGGVSWILFAGAKLFLGYSQMTLLNIVALKTYNGTLYGILGLWYVPATVSFVILLALVSLIRNETLPHTTFLAIFSILFTSLYLTHVSEAVVLAAVIAVFALIYNGNSIRIREAAISASIGLGIAGLIYLGLGLVLVRYAVSLSLALSIVLPIMGLLGSLILKTMLKRRPLKPIRFPSIMQQLTLHRIVYSFSLSIAISYASAIVTNLLLVSSFYTYQVNDIGIVPWFLYPLILGVSGFLAMLSILILSKQPENLTRFGFVICFLVLTILAGRAVSVVNVYLFPTGYWEKRFIWFVKIPLAMIAPISVIAILEKLEIPRFSRQTKTLATVFVAGLIVVGGFSTTILNVEYWHLIVNNESGTIDYQEFEAIESLGILFNKDSRSWLATITDTSAHACTRAAPPDQLVLKQLLYTARTPEMAFTQLYRHPAYTHPYIYLAERDRELLNSQDCSYLSSYLHTQPVVYENNVSTIYNATQISAPLKESSTVLVTPTPPSNLTSDSYWAYQALSATNINYTTMFDQDDGLLDAESIILGYDPSPLGDEWNSNGFDFGSSGWEVQSGLWQLDNQSLQGGNSVTATTGVVTSTLYSISPRVKFSVRPTDPYPGVPNYLGFIFAYEDAENYKIAELVFHDDQNIYFLIRTVNGTNWAEGTTTPNWPGYNTSLQWNSNTWFDYEISIDSDSAALSINGSSVVDIPSLSPVGRIGFFYSRFLTVNLDKVGFGSSLDWEYRPPDKTEFDFQEGLDNWQIVDGEWTTTNQSIVAGDLGRPTTGLILMPLSLGRIDANFTIAPRDSTPDVPNYAGFVHSFQDTTHYKIVEFLFNNDGHVYVLTRAIDGTDWVDGVTTPDWPGIDTGIAWNNESLLEVQVEILEDSTRLWLNGTQVLSQTTTNSVGELGLFYSRFNSLHFSNMSIVGSLPWSDPEFSKLTSVDSTLPDWLILSGLWYNTNDTLVSVPSELSDPQVILGTTPLSVFSSSFTVEPYSFGDTTSGSSGIVFSFQGNQQFSLIEIVFYQDGFIYVLPSFVNGSYWSASTGNPDWPGNNTGLSWVDGESFRISSNVTFTGIVVSVNGVEVLSETMSVEPGRVGLFGQGLSKILFNNFSLTGCEKSPLREIQDFLDFAEHGGHLLVLNTNGYNWFANNLFDISAYSIYSLGLISYNDERYFDAAFQVPILIPRNDVTILASYTSFDETRSPCIFDLKVGDGNIVYVNVYPAIQSFQIGLLDSEIVPILEALTSILELERAEEHYIQSDGYVQNIELANATIYTKSVVFPEQLISSVVIRTNVEDIVLTQLSHLRMSDTGFKVIADYLSFADGLGFYSSCLVNQSFRILPLSDTINLVSATTQLGVQNILNVSEIVFLLSEPIRIYLHLPSIRADSVLFSNLYSQNNLYDITQSYGHDVHILNGVSFDVPLADTFTMLQSVEINGSWTISPQPASYDEFSTLIKSIPVALVVIPISLILIVFLRKKEIV